MHYVSFNLELPQSPGVEQRCRQIEVQALPGITVKISHLIARFCWTEPNGTRHCPTFLHPPISRLLNAQVPINKDDNFRVGRLSPFKGARGMSPAFDHNATPTAINARDQSTAGRISNTAVVYHCCCAHPLKLRKELI
jgi:hypothetical protein